MCPLVELNKERPAKLKDRKSFKKDGKNLERLFCEHHLLNGSKAEVAHTFLDSVAYKDRQSKDPSLKMCAFVMVRWCSGGRIREPTNPMILRRTNQNIKQKKIFFSLQLRRFFLPKW